MAGNFEFDIDSRNKLGGDVQWEDSDDFSAFVHALNSGITVRSNGVASVVESTDDIKLDEASWAELKSRLGCYR